jgi:hypothetical protein
MYINLVNYKQNITWHLVLIYTITSVNAGLCSILCLILFNPQKRQSDNWTVVDFTAAKFKWLVAPFVFKITPLRGPHGKLRLPVLWMHVYSCVAWQRTFYISVILLGADRIGKYSFPSIVDACPFLHNCSLATNYNIRPTLGYSVAGCLSSRCLAMLWANPLQYNWSISIQSVLFCY